MGKSTIGKGTKGKALIRCAIYTRKSSEDGLEQDFNSLDAQRESCEAFILSQKHEGWTALPGMYDDGGLSGGTLERPALKRILADIEGHRIDTVVVYKVDRLTRSLGDFAKIVEIFDKRKVSFVSVTQQFNTTTSMGRLTLNMLLSFAQFEREVTGERIRDKIAASKKKGMWMGGNVSLGYVVKERKLLIDEAAAKTVRDIYRRYVTLGSVRSLKEELERDGVVGKVRVDRYGRATGGKPLARGALYTMLQNRIYRGRIVHKDKHYPGAHEAIVDEALWDAVQRQLAANRIACASPRGTPRGLVPVPQASAPRRMTRCPRRSLRPPRQSRRFGEHASRLPRESPRATPCRSANETAGRVLPWLSHVIRSGVSEPSLTLVGSRQWSRLPSFPHRSRTRAPSLHRRYPASAVIQAPPPPCWPGLPLTGFRLARATPPTGLPVLPPSPSSMRAAVNTPAGSAGARVARFPAGASLPRYSAGRPPRCPFRGLLDVHSRCGPHGR